MARDPDPYEVARLIKEHPEVARMLAEANRSLVEAERERDEARAERNHLAALLRDWLARDELGGSWPYLKQDSRAALTETQEGE